MSAEPSRAMLSIDRSEPTFESHTGGKIMKTSKILTVFVNFLANSNSKLFCPDKENERQVI